MIAILCILFVFVGGAAATTLICEVVESTTAIMLTYFGGVFLTVAATFAVAAAFGIH